MQQLVPVPVRGWVVGRWMAENGWLTRYCTPLEVQRTHDCIFKKKKKLRTNRLYLLVHVRAGTYCCTAVPLAHIGWSVWW